MSAAAGTAAGGRAGGRPVPSGIPVLPRAADGPGEGRTLAHLLLGLALGPGLLLAVQMLLLARGAHALAALAAAALAAAGLAQAAIDWGGTLLLARRARLRAGADPAAEAAAMSADLAALALARLPVALAAALLLGGLALAGALPLPAFHLAALPGLLLGALGMAGLLDGAGAAGRAGQIQALPLLAAALALLLLAGERPEAAALPLGLAFSAGATAALLLQWRILRARGLAIRLRRPPRGAAAAAFAEGLAVQAALMPGQILARGQVLAAGLVLPETAAALYATARAAASGVQQAAGLARRAAFPGLVALLRAGPAGPGRLLRHEARSLALAALALPVLVLAPAAALLDPALALPGLALALAAPALPGAAVFAALGQGLAARGADLALAGCTALVALLALLPVPVLALVPAGPAAGLALLVAAEPLAHGAGILLLLRRLRRAEGRR